MNPAHYEATIWNESIGRGETQKAAFKAAAKRLPRVFDGYKVDFTAYGREFRCVISWPETITAPAGGTDA